MNVIQTDENILVIRTSYRKKEILFSAAAVVITSILVLLFTWVRWEMRAGFMVLVVVTVIVNISDEEECTVDKKKGTLKIKRFGPFSETRVLSYSPP
jgi:hypothetical protein